MQDGTLVDRVGHVVLGFAGQGAAPAPLRADPVDVALGVAAGASIAPDGTVAYERATVDPLAARSCVASGAKFRSLSRIDFDTGLERLQEAYLAFDALRAANTAQGSLDKTSMDLLK